MLNWFFNLPTRTRFGIAAAILLVAALISYVGWLARWTNHPPSGPLLGVATVLFLIWLAWDDLSAVPSWFWWVFPIFLVVGAFRPILLLAIVPAVFMLCFLWPRKKK